MNSLSSQACTAVAWSTKMDLISSIECIPESDMMSWVNEWKVGEATEPWILADCLKPFF